jgi:hypothetical protein
MAKGKGQYGHPGSSGQAQSGGRNTTFGGGKGGTAESRGVTQGRKIARGRLNNGLGYNVRTEGGSSTLKPESFHVGQPPPLRGGDSTKTKKVTIRKPVRGGDR